MHVIGRKVNANTEELTAGLLSQSTFLPRIDNICRECRAYAGLWA